MRACAAPEGGRFAGGTDGAPPECGLPHLVQHLRLCFCWLQRRLRQVPQLCVQLHIIMLFTCSRSCAMSWRTCNEDISRRAALHTRKAQKLLFEQKLWHISANNTVFYLTQRRPQWGHHWP
jgi:hypothetical protein